MSLAYQRDCHPAWYDGASRATGQDAFHYHHSFVGEYNRPCRASDRIGDLRTVPMEPPTIISGTPA